MEYLFDMSTVKSSVIHSALLFFEIMSFMICLSYEAWSYKKGSMKKDYRIQKICLERTYSQKMSVNSRLKATKIIGQREAFYRQRIPEPSC